VSGLGRVQDSLAAFDDGVVSAVVEVGGSHVPDARVVVNLVVPVEESATLCPGLGDGPEAPGSRAGTSRSCNALRRRGCRWTPAAGSATW
jgi:hypothetical protein